MTQADGILIDTTVWVDAFRGREVGTVAHVRTLLLEDRVLTCGPVLCEIRRGLRAPERGRVLSSMNAIRRLPFADVDWESAGDLDADLRARGITIAPFDVLIAHIAVRERVRLWTMDTHFASVPGLALYGGVPD